MLSNCRHRMATSSPEPANANQNGAVIPNVFASVLERYYDGRADEATDARLT